MARIAREAYAAIFGPTAGDQIRLGDTDLWIEIEQDLTFGGEESVFGGGKSIRESGNQALTTSADGALDTVITNVVILDHWGIVRADVGIRDGPDRRHRPQRQPGHRRRGRPGAGHRAGHRRDLRRGQDPHRRRLRLARALPVAVADPRGAGRRADHPGRRRHRAVGGVQGHHGDPGRLAPEAGPPRARRVPGQPAAAGQGQHRVGGGLRGAGAGRGRRLQGARGLGIHPGGGRRGAEGRRGVGAAGRAALGLAERGRLRGQHRRRDRRPEHLGLPRRGRRRRARPGHPDHRRAAARAARVDQPDPAAHGEHRRRAPRHADGLPPPEPGGAGGPGLRRVPDPGHHDRGRRSSARPRSDLDHLLRRPGDGPDRRGDHPHLAGRPRDEAGPRRAGRRAAGRQLPGPALRGEVHDQPGDQPRCRSRDRVGRGRQAGRPGAVGSALLRRTPVGGDQGRRHRGRRAGRPERLHPHPAAGADAAGAVLRQRAVPVPVLRRPGRAGGRAGRRARAGAASWSRSARPGPSARPR